MNFVVPSSVIAILLVIINGFTTGSGRDVCPNNGWTCALQGHTGKNTGNPTLTWQHNPNQEGVSHNTVFSSQVEQAQSQLWALPLHLVHLHLAGPPAEREREKLLMRRRQPWEYEQKHPRDIKTFFDDEALSYSTVLWFIDLVSEL